MPALVDALERSPSERLHILDFGSAEPHLLTSLTDRAPRWLVLDLRHELWTGTAPEDLSHRVERLLGEYASPEAPFDLVLTWNLLDYLPRAVVSSLARKLESYLGPKTRWHALLSARPLIPTIPPRLRLEQTESGLLVEWQEVEEELTREPERWSPGELERELVGFTLEKSFFLAVGIHEVLLVRGKRIQPGRPLAPRQVAHRPKDPPKKPV